MASVKLVVICVAVVLSLLGLKASLPCVTTHLPLIWNLLLLCFKPPYLYLFLNAIIISILASSTLLHSPPPNPTPTPLPPQFPQNDIAQDPPVLEVKEVAVNGSAAVDQEEEVKEIDLGILNSIDDYTWISSSEIPSPMEKPPFSARFGHRNPLKSRPEGGRALRMVKAEEHETLENTWKAITEADGGCRQKRDVWGPLEVRKSATFKDRTSHHPPPVSKLRKEPSLSQDELNRRAEAFIRNFNQQARLQRQESLNQHMQMINRGSN